MTGGHEDAESRREFPVPAGDEPPGPAAPAGSGPGGSDAERVSEAETRGEVPQVGPPDADPGGDERTRPSVAKPDLQHPPPSYVDPSRIGPQPPSHAPSGGFPAPPHGSGPYATPQSYGQPPPPNAPAETAQSSHFQQPLYGMPHAGPAAGPPGSGPWPGAGHPGQQPQQPPQQPQQQGPHQGGPPPQSAPYAHAAPTAPSQHPQQPQNPQNLQNPQGPQLQPDLSSAQLLRQSKPAPQSGWRRAVYLASGRRVNPGESAAEARHRELVSRVNQPLQGCYKIAMLSLKGGVGKTTVAATLGATFSSLRGDRVVAVDANPDRGTLAQRIPLETTATVRHLLRDAQRIRRYSDVRSYTSQGPSRLEVLASEQDPSVSEAFSEDDYRRVVTMLEHFYNVVLTDCGTGLMHSAMRGVLDVADSLVVVSSSSIDGARSASATLDWLDAHGCGALVARSVAVINGVRPGARNVDVDKVVEHFGARCRSVVRIPFDPHLEEGAEVELDRLGPQTRLALLELAATAADDFPRAGWR